LSPQIAQVKLNITAENERESYNPELAEVNLNQNSNARTVIHEVGHRLEYENTGWMKYDNDFHYSRTQHEGAKALKEIYPHSGYEDGETTYENDWQSLGGTAYSGKLYSDRATEILTTGLERMYENPLEFALKDPDFFSHVFKVIRE
jgi:hypothetical protein